jgi:hypothetical protein
MKFGGVNYSATTFTTTAAIQDMKIIQNRNSASSQVGTTPNFTSFSTGSVATVTSTINTNDPVNITFTGQHAVGTNTITLERYLVELIVP